MNQECLQGSKFLFVLKLTRYKFTRFTDFDLTHKLSTRVGPYKGANDSKMFM